MKIAYLINQYPNITHTFIRREIHALEQLGVEVQRISMRSELSSLVDQRDIDEFHRTHIVTRTPVSVAIKSVLKELVTAPIRTISTVGTSVSLGFQAQNITKHLIYFIEACVVKHLTTNYKCSHIHSHFGTNATTIALLSKRLGGPSYSFTVHGPEEFDKPIALSLNRKIRESTFVAGVSLFGRSQLLRWADTNDWGKVHVVRCGVDVKELCKSDNVLRQKNKIVCVGRLSEQKGQLVLIDAVSKLKLNGIKMSLNIIGDGPMRSIIEQRISSLNLEDDIQLLGWLPQSQIVRELKSATAMVLPSFAEGLPVAIMESLAVQTPVITTYIAGIPELVENGVNGWVVAPSDTDALQKSLCELSALTTDQLNEYGIEGQRRVESKHSSIIEAKKLAAIFTQCQHVET